MNKIKKQLNEPLYFDHYWQYLLLVWTCELICGLLTAFIMIKYR